MIIMNFLNCRIVNPKSLNIFDHIFGNFWFISIVALASVLQIVFLEYFYIAFNASYLTDKQYAYCVMVGCTTWIVSSILKLTPASWVEKIPVKVDENKAIDPNDKVMAAYAKQANAKVVKK